MTYVEWLRVRGCLKWTAIVLVVGVAVLLFGRFTYLDIKPHSAAISGVQIGDETLAQFEHESTQTQSKLPDGTLQTVIYNPRERIRVTINDRGYWGKHVEIFERKAPAGVRARQINFGDLHFQRVILPSGSLVRIDLGPAAPEDLNYYFILATFVALIVATVLGAPFARENDGHLEITLTKPISRERLALHTVALDLAGIVSAWIMTVVALIVGHTIFEAPNYVYGPSDSVVIAVGLLSAFAWYSLLCASTTSMKRSYGAVLGVAWPVALGVQAWPTAVAKLGNGPLAQLVGAVTAALGWLNPLSYLHFGRLFVSNSVAGTATGAASATYLSYDVPILAVLAFVYAALAIWQWRRVEA